MLPTPNAGDRDGVFSGLGGLFSLAWAKDSKQTETKYAPMMFYPGV
jgi:hypothetical protein